MSNLRVNLGCTHFYYPDHQNMIRRICTGRTRRTKTSFYSEIAQRGQVIYRCHANRQFGTDLQRW